MTHPARRRGLPPQTLLAALPLFAAVHPATLTRLAESTRYLELPAGAALFHEGDPVAGIDIVVQGQLRLATATGGRRRVLGTVGPGRSLGEAPLFLERPAPFDAEAQADSLLLHLPKEAVFAEVERDPGFARGLIGSLSARAEGLVRDLEAQSRTGARARLIEFLLQHAGDARGEFSFTLLATKAAIAARLHITPEHFSRLLRELTAAGLLRVDQRHITIVDTQRLAEYGAARLPSAHEADSGTREIA